MKEKKSSKQNGLRSGPDRGKPKKLRLIFAADKVCTVGYVGPAEDKMIDQLLAAITVKKSTVPCG